MDTVDHLVTGFLKVNHSHGKTIPSGTLHRGLKQRTTNNLIPTPLPCICALSVDSDPDLLLPPRSGDQLELWPLPADEST